MFEGFIPGSRASLMFDVVCLGMIIILPLLAYSIYLVRIKKNYQLHKRFQLVLGWTLLIVVVLFEIDVRLSKQQWIQATKASPFYQTILTPFLIFHVIIATLTVLLWVVTIVNALRHFQTPPVPNAYSKTHRKLGIASAIFMFTTGITGISYYVMAFVLGN